MSAAEKRKLWMEKHPEKKKLYAKNYWRSKHPKTPRKRRQKYGLTEKQFGEILT